MYQYAQGAQKGLTATKKKEKDTRLHSAHAESTTPTQANILRLFTTVSRFRNRKSFKTTFVPKIPELNQIYR